MSVMSQGNMKAMRLRARQSKSAFEYNTVQLIDQGGNQIELCRGVEPYISWVAECLAAYHGVPLEDWRPKDQERNRARVQS